MSDILPKLQGVFCEVFGDDDLVITGETNANDIPDWDSMMHVNLILSIEKEFDVSFTSSEIGGLFAVSDLLNVLAAKC